MKIRYILPDDSDIILSCSSSTIANFCAFDYLYNFSSARHNLYSYDDEIVKEIKDKKEAILDFIKHMMARCSRGSKLFIGDRVNHGFHEHITPYLPKKFEAKNSRGTKIECTVEQGEPYINLNTRAKVRETIIHIKNVPAKRKRKN